jgi:flavin reductase (DIM6/NTAB) family NADH-FMN oxidoreductase RutF
MSKKKFRARAFFYPLTTIIAGANVNDKANFVTIAFCGMFHYKPPMLYISSGKNHYTNQGIKENQTYSVNFPSVDMVQATDYIGIKSGKEIDKSELFDVFYGELKTAPMINEAPMNHECRLVKVLDLGGTNEIFLGEIIQTYIDEDCLINGKPDIRKLRPILFAGIDRNYLEIGKNIGEAYKIGKNYEKK